MTPRQEKFCVEYLIDLNATQAAIRAGYSEKTAYSMGQRLLKNVEIKSRIKELQDKVFEDGIRYRRWVQRSKDNKKTNFCKRPDKST